MTQDALGSLEHVVIVDVITDTAVTAVVVAGATTILSNAKDQ